MKRRYDTSFFLTILPPSSAPASSASSFSNIHSDHIATADNGETISADWLTPLEAIRRTILHTASLQSATPTGPPKESIILFPPQFYLLAELASTKNWQDVLDGKLSDLGGLPLARPRSVTPFEPEIKGVVDASGAFRAATVLVGDPEHSKTEPSKAEEGDRHRTYVLLPAKPKTEDEKERWRKNPPLGLTVMGVERKGMGRLFGDGWEDMKVGDCGEEGQEKAKL
jgi:nucleoside diphosphate-linked moiety X motif 19, mitochondrial